MLSLPSTKFKRPSRLTTFIVATFVTTAGFMMYGLGNDRADAAVPGWNAGNIISDGVMTNKTSMSAAAIQSFLNDRMPNCDTWGVQPSEYGGGTRRQWAEARGYSAPFTCLRDYSENGKTAAQIIYDASHEFNINPQVLIVLLQKEQGLVTDAWPVSIQYKTATGYGCPDTAPCDSQYYGLTNQLRWAARMFRAIMNASPSWYTPYVVGNNYIQYNPNKSCGGTNVTIQNRATQALYNYTPYQPNQGALDATWGTANCGAYGNRNFYLYFTNWFGSTQGWPYHYGRVWQGIYSDAARTTQINDANNHANLAAGQTVYLRLVVVNRGANTWTANTVKLAPHNPRDRGSAMWDSSWLAGNRIAYMKESTVRPGENATFEFAMKAPNNAAYFQEDLTLVMDGAAWFNNTNTNFKFTITAPPAPPQTGGNGGTTTPPPPANMLDTNKGLKPGQWLKSSNGKYSLHMQNDGNLVLYSQRGAIWGSGTNARSIAAVYMQADGNLVMYDTNNRPTWASNSGGGTSPKLFVQDDGNVVIYSGSKALWATGTSGRW